MPTNQKERETPESDAMQEDARNVVLDFTCRHPSPKEDETILVVPLDFARKLELQRDEARGELAFIDSILARRPALDNPTRALNIEKAITVASQSDRLKTRLDKIEGVAEELCDQIGREMRSDKHDGHCSYDKFDGVDTNSDFCNCDHSAQKSIDAYESYKSETR